MNPLVEQLLAELAPQMAAHTPKTAVLYYVDSHGMPRSLGEVSEGATRAERRRNDRLARKAKS